MPDAISHRDLKQLEDHHQYQLQHMQNVHEMEMIELNKAIDAIDAALDIAKETKDFSTVIELMHVSSDIVSMRSEFKLRMMERTTGITPLTEGNSVSGYLK